MADFFPALEPKHEEMLANAPMYFVATAAPTGHVNLSPKGLDTLRILSPSRVAYLDLTGSGNETAAHLLQSNRITLMACSFTRTALILRIYGTARSIQPGQPEWSELIALFPQITGTRQIFDIAIETVQTSCGYGVPQMELVAQRDTLVKWAKGKTAQELEEYRATNNLSSIDSFPTGLQSPSDQ